MKAKRINPSESSRLFAGATKKQLFKSKMDKQKLLEVACRQICSAGEKRPNLFSPSNAFGTIVTSTQRKSHFSSQSTLKFLIPDFNVESISPVEAVEVAHSNRASAVKHQQTELKLTEEVSSNRSRSPSKYPELSLNYLSHNVVVTRGKFNPKTEKEKRTRIYLQSQRNKGSYSITLRRTLEAVRYFRKQLADEIQRLQGKCEKWKTYQSENLLRLQETVGDDMINVAIGKTKLLTSNEFKQFSGLIDRCEKGATSTLQVVNDGGEDTNPISPEDLERFWYMLRLQTDNIVERFANLDRWCENDWIDPDFSKQQAAKVLKPTITSMHKSTFNAKAKTGSTLQQLMGKMHADDLRKKKAMAASKENVKGVDSEVKLTPLRERASGETGTPQRNQTEFLRVSIIVKDRLLHSATHTRLARTTPKRRSLSQTPRLKPILKTSGAAKGKPKNVSFNEKLKIKKFKITSDSDQSDTDEKENVCDEKFLTGLLFVTVVGIF